MKTFPHLWIPRVGVIESELHNPEVAFAGEYTIRKYKADTDELVQQIGPFHNLLTDSCLEQWGSGSAFDYCVVGSGTATPTVADTALGSYVAHTDNIPSGSAVLYDTVGPDYWGQRSGTYRFEAGTATGTLAEVGMCFGDPPSSYTLTSHARIVDGGGSPTTITVLSDEYLDVTFTLRAYPTTSDSIQTVVISGVNYTFTSRLLSAGATGVGPFNSSFTLSGASACTGDDAVTPPALAAITATAILNPGYSAFSWLASSPYVASSKTRQATLNAGLTELNFDYGIRGLTVESSTGSGITDFKYQTTISPGIPKDNTKVLSFGLKYSWGRYP